MLLLFILEPKCIVDVVSFTSSSLTLLFVMVTAADTSASVGDPSFSPFLFFGVSCGGFWLVALTSLHTQYDNNYAQTSAALGPTFCCVTLVSVSFPG